MAVFCKLKDPFSGLSHLLGAFLSIARLAVLVTMAVQRATVWHVVSFAVYGISMVLLYTASALYHLLPLSPQGEKMLRTLDHVMIYMLIAGTLPLSVWFLYVAPGDGASSEWYGDWRLPVSIFVSIFQLNAPRWLSTSIYLLMGWVCIVAIYPIIKLLTPEGLLCLCVGINRSVFDLGEPAG